jgi:hypothetical protein
MKLSSFVTNLYIIVLLLTFDIKLSIKISNSKNSEFLSSKILYRKDLESMTSIPVLGEIAQNEEKESIVIKAGKRSFIAEEFRKIRASLHFLGINSENKKILIKVIFMDQ